MPKNTASQFGRFIIVGLINTFVDFAVLNGLIAIFGLDHGNMRFAVFKSISFLAAAANSFLLNKNWVFEDRSKRYIGKQVAGFLTVSIAGLIINLAVSYLVFALGSTIFPYASPQVLANIGALCGTGAVLLWNFLGYKKWVFAAK